MAQLMPLSLAVSCFSKIQIGFTFLVPAHLGSPGKGPLNMCCVCVCDRVPVWTEAMHQLRISCRRAKLHLSSSTFNASPSLPPTHRASLTDANTPYTLIQLLLLPSDEWYYTNHSTGTDRQTPDRLTDVLYCRRALHSAGTNRLVVPPVRLATVGSRAFPVAAAHTWNSLPEHIVSASMLQSCKRHLKTFLLQQSFRLAL